MVLIASQPHHSRVGSRCAISKVAAELLNLTALPHSHGHSESPCATTKQDIPPPKSACRWRSDFLVCICIVAEETAPIAEDNMHGSHLHEDPEHSTHDLIGSTCAHPTLPAGLHQAVHRAWQAMLHHSGKLLQELRTNSYSVQRHIAAILVHKQICNAMYV